LPLVAGTPTEPGITPAAEDQLPSDFS
jgi:hypothetical protein